MPLPTAVLELLSEQDGLITHAQALAHGISEWTVQRRVRSGDWHRLHPRVYLVGGHPHTEPSRVRAAGLWADGRGVISGPAAAFWLGMLPSVPGRIEVTVPRGGAACVGTAACASAVGTSNPSTGGVLAVSGTPTVP